MTQPELSHPVRLDRLGAAPVTVSLRPDARTRSALAERFGLVAIESFAAELSVRRRPGAGWIEVSGAIDAGVVQTCVVTMEPVTASVHAEVLELFDDSAEEGGELDLDPAADWPEPVTGDTLDVGELAAQGFGLALDPYPRAPGVGPVEIADAGNGASGDGGTAAASPFAKLADLRGRAVGKE